MSNYPVEFFSNDVDITDLIKYHITYVKLTRSQTDLSVGKMHFKRLVICERP